MSSSSLHHYDVIQVTTQDKDPLCELLKDVPEPTAEMLTNQHTTVHLNLIQTRDNLGLSWSFQTSCGVCVWCVWVVWRCAESALCVCVWMNDYECVCMWAQIMYVYVVVCV